MILLGIPLFAVASFFTGSRAPFAILGASVFVLDLHQRPASQMDFMRITSGAAVWA